MGVSTELCSILLTTSAVLSVFTICSVISECFKNVAFYLLILGHITISEKLGTSIHLFNIPNNNKSNNKKCIVYIVPGGDILAHFLFVVMFCTFFSCDISNNSDLIVMFHSVPLT